MPAPKKKPARKPAPKAPKGVSLEVAAEIFKRLAKSRPDPKTELDYIDPFTLVVAVALSAQATDVGVNKATKALFKASPTRPQKMLALGEDRRSCAISSRRSASSATRRRTSSPCRGSDHRRARRRRTPNTRDLEALPGVGRKTASVVLNEAYRRTTIAVDTHVFRVSNRTGLAPASTPDKVEAT
jgi:endonuclease-3